MSLFTTDTMTLFFAILAVLVQIALVAVAALWVSGNAGRTWVDGWITPSALWMAWAVAGIATLGSVYFSEVAHFAPCRLCWYQRIAMYPLSAILLIAAIRKDQRVSGYVLPLSVMGAAIAGYHSAIEQWPSLEGGSCDPEVPCTVVWFERFGYLTLPVMAFTAFLFITVAVLLAQRGHTETAPPEP